MAGLFFPEIPAWYCSGQSLMQDEFEKMIGKTVTPEDYSNIELVYTFYPGDMTKQVFADLYVELKNFSKI